MKLYVNKKQYIQVETIPSGCKVVKVDKVDKVAEEQDKIAKLYALAETLNVKIGGKNDTHV